VEEFYTIQGEGFHTGKPAYFIRLGGCDIGCAWCDTKFSWDRNLHPLVEAEKIIEHASSHPARAVVVTGGEPSMYPLDMLCDGLKERGIRTFIETSGTYHLSGTWDWICLSPKLHHPPVGDVFSRADELKVIISHPSELKWAEECATRVGSECLLFCSLSGAGMIRSFLN
jgi:7-carboxy-7-deazaguanine synthase